MTKTTKRETQHTPGPWQIEGFNFITSAKTGVHVATLPEFIGPNGRESKEPNARLIAAAPDLLEALEALLATADRRAASAGLGWYFQHCPECAGVNVHTPTNTCERHAASAAIAKAKGE